MTTNDWLGMATVFNLGTHGIRNYGEATREVYLRRDGTGWLVDAVNMYTNRIHLFKDGTWRYGSGTTFETREEAYNAFRAQDNKRD